MARLTQSISTADDPLGDLDGAVLDGFRVFDVREFDSATVQAWSLSGTWGTAQLTIECSNNRFTWAGIPAGAVTLNAAGMTSTIDVSGLMYLRARVSTANGTAQVIRLTAGMKGA